MDGDRRAELLPKREELKKRVRSDPINKKKPLLWSPPPKRAMHPFFDTGNDTEHASDSCKDDSYTTKTNLFKPA